LPLQIVLDGDVYASVISPGDEPKFQVNLSSGQHECYVKIILNNENKSLCSNTLVKYPNEMKKFKLKRLSSIERDDERFAKSNIFTTHYSRSTPSGKCLLEDTAMPVHSRLVKDDLPAIKLNVQSIGPTSFVVNWYHETPMTDGLFVALYEVRLPGVSARNNVKSHHQ
jgi:hypothetical protein